MKKVFSLMCLAIVATFMIVGCGGKKAPKPEIGELVTYTDLATKFEIKYPKGWITANEIGNRFVAYSSPEVQKEFKNLMSMETEEEIPGTRIDFLTVKVEEGKTIDDIIKSAKMFDQSIYSAPESITIDGTPAFKQKYSFPFNANSVFNGEIYYATKDSQLVNIIIIDDIGNNLDALRPKIKEILASVKLGTKPSAVTNKKDSTVQADGPSATTKAVNGNGFTVQIPDNFKMSGSGSSFMISGDRRGDCYLSVTIKDAKKNNLEKVADAFKGSLGNYTKTTFGGSEVAVFNMKAKANLDAKMYLAVRNNQIYQVVVSYYKPEADLFKVAFDKMAKSFKFQ